jgi:hypothetical protein
MNALLKDLISFLEIIANNAITLAISAMEI